MSFISLKNISYNYSGMFPALHDINLDIQQGELLAILGSNGTGKSSLMNVMAGLVFPDKGKYLIGEKEVTEKNLKDRHFNNVFRRTIGYVFQNTHFQLFCPTVFDELIFGPLQLGMKIEEASERAAAVMKMLGIVELGKRSTHMLSGGERKKVALGSILTYNPQIILFDEPMSGLDPRSQSFLIELIFKLNEAGKTIVITTHNLELAAHLQPKIAILSEDHRLIKTGAADDVLSDVDFLISVNLIHESLHRHNGTLHSHLSPLSWSHKHSKQDS
jgi:cobalt/nickel transport system ATP-binding protein